ncbi:MAG: dehydrogenase E1 component subunit alpha/beta [Ignavibacteriaceae bacterium]|nr:dehydrogenase E1 component subunit alpha/beta [Ignavibacteriaceae bacterium]
MKFSGFSFSEEKLLQLYKDLVTPRLIEEKMLNLLRQGKISKWFSGIGQEAISVGAASALLKDEFILPLIRNLGIFTTRRIPLHKLFAQFQGKKNGFTKGRDRSFHFGSKEHHIVGMISHLGPQLSVADGIALWELLNETKKVVLVFSGDGGTSEGDFHESLNLAAVWNLPVIFLVENNGYGLSTPNDEQFKCQQLIDKGIGYGIEAIRIDGNNILEVYSTLRNIASEMRKNPKPFLVEAVTFRMRGHEEASGTNYVPKQLIEEWKNKDPIFNYENFLISKNIISLNEIAKIKDEISTLINSEWHRAEDDEILFTDSEEEVDDVYAKNKVSVSFPKSNQQSEKRFIDAISDGLKLAMEKYENLILMGQDIAEYGGAFKVTKGFVEQFGKERVRNTPLCESAVIGSALGYGIKGGKAIVEMQFADFISCGFNQVVNNLAKIHYRWGQSADVVLRMPTGAGVAAGPFHSQSNEAWFFHTPGLKIVYPSNPFDAKGLLLASIEDPNPVLFFEHKLLYRSLHGLVPDDYYTIEIGKGSIVREGTQCTIITYGMGVHWASEALKDLSNPSVEIIDLRTLLPLDEKIIYSSVKKTGKVLILHEDTLTGGIGAEIAALISQHCFEYLDAPIIRCGSLDSPVPFSYHLEKNYLPKDRFRKALQNLLSY